MPGSVRIPWMELVKPSYVTIFPELVVVGLILVIMVADLFVKEKRTLVWVTLAGIALAIFALYWAATDSTPPTADNPLNEFFGRTIIKDQLAFFMKGVLLFVAGMVTLLSVDYVEKYLKGLYIEFYEVLLTATLGMMLMVGSQDLIAIYIGLELSSISSYILAGLLRHDPKSNEAGLKYFLNGALASAVILFGVSILFGRSGTTYLPDMAKALGEIAKNSAELPLLIVGTLFLVVGFGFKIAAAPMHLWAPDAYEGAPTPVTAFFSVGPKGAAFGAILRVFMVGLGASHVAAVSQRWTLLFAILATASMFLGNLTAIVQSNVKRMMAYSSIAQAGYILVGVVASGSGRADAAQFGASGVLFYVLAYAVTNLGIFAVLTHLDQAGESTRVEDFKGLSQRAPLYAWVLLFCFISLIGIPPTIGFFGKLFLFRAAASAGYLWLALVMAVNSVISVGYYYGIVKAMFLEKSDKEALPPNFGATATVVVSFIGVVLVGLLGSNWVLEYTQAAAKLLAR